MRIFSKRRYWDDDYQCQSCKTLLKLSPESMGWLLFINFIYVVVALIAAFKIGTIMALPIIFLMGAAWLVTLGLISEKYF